MSYKPAALIHQAVFYLSVSGRLIFLKTSKAMLPSFIRNFVKALPLGNLPFLWVFLE